MVKTRFMVFQLKQIIRMGIFVLIGLVILIMLITFLTPRRNNQSTALFVPGTYTSQIILHNRPVLVEVTVTRDQIVSVELTNMLESQEVFYPLFRPTMDELSREIVRYQSTGAVTVADSAPVTGKILIDAVDAALAKATI